ncbi:hypothetical protein D9M72_410990 [compost metagenome]
MVSAKTSPLALWLESASSVTVPVASMFAPPRIDASMLVSTSISAKLNERPSAPPASAKVSALASTVETACTVIAPTVSFWPIWLPAPMVARDSIVLSSVSPILRST